VKTILSLRKAPYLKRASIFLIAVALIAGMLSCDGGAQYDLAMAVNPVGGGTATDLTGTSHYAANTNVDIQAVPAADYKFVNWTVPAGTFADANDPSTTFIMPAQDVTVTANFVMRLDHFIGYSVEDATAPYIGEVVYLEDQFCAVNATVGYAVVFGNPAKKFYNDVWTSISHPDHHVTVYNITYEEEPQTWFVEVKNQFGTQELTVRGPTMLAVPTQKVIPGGHEPPVDLDHFLLYEVIDGPYLEQFVGLNDQFGDNQDVLVYEPIFFANPVRKRQLDNVTEIVNMRTHAVIYWIDGEYFETQVEVANQFGGNQTLDVSGPDYLFVPSQKLSFAPALDHFKCYPASDISGEPVDEVMCLEDQFVNITANVTSAFLFCNPADKLHGDVLTPILNPNHHLTLYNLSWEGDPQQWLVMVENQFGPQQLVVSGPVGLAVPTQKEGHDPPVGLDHFLLYEVIQGESVEVVVGLNDQFGYEPEVPVYWPVLFANPIRKIQGAEVTEIRKSEAHLLFYHTRPLYFEGEVQVANHFGNQTLELGVPDLLAVPSEKIGFTTGPPLATVAVIGDYDSQLADLLRFNGIWAEEGDWDVTSDNVGDYDVVVINWPLNWQAVDSCYDFVDFLDAASDNGVGVVFTSSFPHWFWWGITHLTCCRGDCDVTDDFNRGGDVYYKVTHEHPIFEGWSVGDEITIITGFWQDHSWFWDYSGSTIAEVGCPSRGIEGDAVAVGTYGGSTHVLLASLGIEVLGDITCWTNDAKTIFINAVCFAGYVLPP
jgi:hypothetical protein